MSREEFLKNKIKESGYNIKSFSKEIHMPYTTLLSILNSISGVSIGNIIKICNGLDISLDCLNETYYKKKQEFPVSQDEQIHIKKYRMCDERGRGMVDTVLDYEYNRTLEIHEDIKSSEPTIKIPVLYESAAAGFGNYLSDESFEDIEFLISNVPNETDYGVRISGKSMEPTIPDKSIAFIKSRPAIESGKIGMFNLNGKWYCKRISVKDEHKTIFLTSDNKEYKTIEIGINDHLHTYGEVIGWTKP